MANYCVNIFAVCFIIFAFQRQIPDVIYANVNLFCGRGKCEVNQNYCGNGAKKFSVQIWFYIFMLSTVTT